MDAPLYPPSTVFEQPVRIAHMLSTREAPVAELKANAAAWAIVLKQIPSMDARTSSEMLKPHLGNLTLRALSQFGIAKSADLDRIDEQLLLLGPVI
jgi:hypothetical protein